ncbi:dephospho-CoA kinase [Agrobacterium sp. a22-2]|uniref:dephospho-CoA kinase n=1 Tax=Agrobacterium sp. a22-2 TaxID=2283840 RepID=UPI00144732AE|nr:dephospho-CoA kinase [Agrobacterium sp. a22-2]NKN39152.1 dephospho-CoA kinase [Agrobacterium sp. a22-2]
MIRIGLTGSIGMGKSTTAAMFVEQGIAVHDSDRVVHELYQNEAVEPIARDFPEVVIGGVVDRGALSRNLAKNPANFQRLEAIVHPLVRERQRRFVEEQERLGADIVVLDIPLLFETGAQDRVDSIVVVTCDPDIQRARVLQRPGMTEEKFEMILARQVADLDKRRMADFIIDTGQGMEAARRQVADIIATLRSRKEGKD